MQQSHSPIVVDNQNKMEEITIPDSILEQDDLNVQIFDYKSSENIKKQRITLSKHTFSFLIEGQKEVVGSKNSIAVVNTSFLLMQSGRCLMTEKLSPVNKNYRSILLFFSNENIFNFIRTFEIKVNQNQSKKSVYSFPYDDFLKSYLKSIIQISKLPRKKQKNLLRIKLEEILIYLIEKNGSGFLHAMFNQNNQQNQKLISVVETNKLNKLSIKELAFLCNMSVSSFKRAFVKQYKQPPIKWFQDQRLAYASVLLRQERKRPSDIYLDIGYDSLSSFIQAFKSKYGQTPKQYQ